MSTDAQTHGDLASHNGSDSNELLSKNVIKCNEEVLNEIALLKSSLQEVKEHLMRTKDELHNVSAERDTKHAKLVETENKLKRFLEDKEKQSATLIQTNRELQAALSVREKLIEQEDQMRSMIEEAEKAFQICQAADNLHENESTESETDTEDTQLSETTIIFKAKLKEMKSKLQESTKQQSLLEEENTCLRDELKSARDVANTLPLLQNELVTAQSASLQKEERCASLQSQLCRAEVTVQEVKTKILALQEKLIEEQAAAANHCSEAEQLRIVCKEQALLIEELKKSEKEIKEQLETAMKEIERLSSSPPKKSENTDKQDVLLDNNQLRSRETEIKHDEDVPKNIEQDDEKKIKPTTKNKSTRFFRWFVVGAIAGAFVYLYLRITSDDTAQPV